MIKFIEIATRKIRPSRGPVISVTYEDPVTMESANILDREIMPLILAAPVMAEVLRQIAEGSHPGAHTLFDPDQHAVSAIEKIKDLARQALPQPSAPRRRKRRGI